MRGRKRGPSHDLAFLYATGDLQLYNNRIRGPIPSEIGGLHFLKVLYLDGNQLTAHIPSSFGELSELGKGFFRSYTTLFPWVRSSSFLICFFSTENLYLFSNKLQGFIPTGVGQMVKLKNLELSNNLLSGPIPEEFGTLQNLERLWLNNNTLGGQIPSALVQLTSVKSILLHGNRFTGTVPPNICNLNDISELSSDCFEAEPEVFCECCTSCYHD